MFCIVRSQPCKEAFVAAYFDQSDVYEDVSFILKVDFCACRAEHSLEAYLIS